MPPHPRYRALLRYPRAQLPGLAALAGLAGLSAVLAAAQPLPLRLLVDHGLAGRPLPAGTAGAFAAAGLDPSPRTVLLVAAVLSGLAAVAATAVQSATAWRTEAVGLRLTRAVTVDLFDRLQRLPMGFHAGMPAGDAMSRLGTDSYAVYAATHALAVGPLLHLSTLVAVGWSAWRLSPGLTAVLLAVAPALALTAHLAGARVKGRSLHFRRAQAGLVAFVTTVLRALPLVQAFTAERRTLHAMRGRVERAVAAGRRAAVTEAAAESLGGLISALAVGAVLVAGGVQVLRGRLSVGTLLVFLAYARVIEGEARGLLALQRDLR
ncbi:MAG TPA: ABC transporter ATP-binding protein, partial [Pilimelia sp.]|nr:ABC transporter ATP-binding protein [Pilimelia sp.]